MTAGRSVNPFKLYGYVSLNILFSIFLFSPDIQKIKGVVREELEMFKGT